MTRTRRADWFADYLRTTLPEAVKQAEQGSAEFVQTGVWLAGIASALLSLFFVNYGKLPFISRASGKWIVALLGIAIVAGIAQRAFMLFGANREANARFRLLGWLNNYGSDVDFADELEDDWTAEDIVNRLKRYYDFDVSQILTRPDAHAHLQQLYKTVYEAWSKLDRDQVELVMAQVGAYVGWDDEEIKQQLKSYESGETAPKLPGVHHVYWFGLGRLSLIASGVTLAAAIAVACFSFVLS